MWFKGKREEYNGITLGEWLDKHREDFKAVDIEIYAGKANVYGPVCYSYGIGNIRYGCIHEYKDNVVRDAIDIHKGGRLDKVMVFIAK